jgi:hypothetical protein
VLGCSGHRSFPPPRESEAALESGPSAAAECVLIVRL